MTFSGRGELMKFRHIFFWATLLLFTVILAGTAGELFLRFVDYRDEVFAGHYKVNGVTNGDHFTFDQKTGYALVSSIRDSHRDIFTNELGNRVSSSLQRASQQDQKRSIVLVGDSTVFGWGVKGEDTFAAAMARDPRFAAYNIVNAGVPSYSLGHIAAVLKEKVQRHNPALVLVAILWPWKPFEATAAYGSTDGWKTIDFEFYKKVFPVRNSFHEEAPPGWQELRLPVFLKNLYFKAFYAKQIRENMTRPGVRDFTLPKEKEEDLAAQHVVALREAVASFPAEVKVLFYVHPYQYTVFHDEYKHLGEAGYRVLLDGLAIPDLKPLIKSSFHGEPLYIDGSHLTPEGHRVWARLLGDLAAAKLNQKAAGISRPEPGFH